MANDLPTIPTRTHFQFLTQEATLKVTSVELVPAAVVSSRSVVMGGPKTWAYVKANMPRRKDGTPTISVHYTCDPWEAPDLGASIHVALTDPFK